MKILNIHMTILCIFCFSSIGRSQINQPMIMPNGVSVPSNFPHVYITINDNPDTNFIFLTTSWGTYPNYSMILENNGSPIWYMRTGSEERRDFKVQPNGWATLLIRETQKYGPWVNRYIALDEHYEQVRTFRADTSYTTDQHELQVLSDGGYLLIGLRVLTVDMNDHVPGDHRTMNILENCVQEFDASDHLLRKYPAFDYFHLADLWPDQLQNSHEIDFPHMNSIDIDLDGHIILSSRYLDEITKINRYTGEIIWRLGGAHSDFVFKNDELNGFSGQHSARVVGDNRYLLFDNGDRRDPPVSRAVEYELNTDDGTAALRWEFRDMPDRYSWYMGNVQRLPNGNTLINWSVPDSPKLTEVRPDCTKAFEMYYVNRDQCYRVHRCPWSGKANKPYLIVEPFPDKITLLFNQFGDPDVDYYKIYSGRSNSPTTVLDTSRLTMKYFTNLENRQKYTFRVKAVNKNGTESEYSNQESVFVHFVSPGENLVTNGDFPDNFNHWILRRVDDGNALLKVVNGELKIEITEGGSADDKIQVAHQDIPLIHGKEYQFEFDAYAEKSRLFSAEVICNDAYYQNYSRMGSVQLTTSKRHFKCRFNMSNPNVLSAEICMNAGGSDDDVFVDNISLKEITSGTTENRVADPCSYRLYGCSPNPFNPVARIHYSVPEFSSVQISIYNIRGEQVRVLVDRFHSPGTHYVPFDASALASGLYYCEMDACSMKGERVFHSSRKMMFIK